VGSGEFLQDKITMSNVLFDGFDVHISNMTISRATE